MTLPEARHILGLGSEEDPLPQMADLRIVRERIAELVRTEPDAALAERYQVGLVDYDRALAAVREALEAAAPAVPVPEAHPAAALAQAPAAIPAPAAAPPRRSHAPALRVWLLILVLGAAGGGWFHLKIQEENQAQRQIRITRLEREGAAHLENRRWPEASATFDEIERLAPTSQIAPMGRRSIAAGMAEEHQQFAGYWSGQAQAALDAGRWDEAENAARQVLEKFPADQDSAALLEVIAAARAAAARRAAVTAARDLLTRRQWDAAIQAANHILATQPADPDAAALLAEATAARDQAAATLAKAQALFQQAAARDQGQFDQVALDWLREASALAPEDPDISALLEKMASYTRTLRVPRDYPTPTEALANARASDRIIINEGTWQGPLTVNTAIELQGAGPDKTRIECPAEAGCAITLGPAATGSRLSGITFRHESQTAESKRYSAGLVRGAEVSMIDCHFIDACGHGLAVIESGQAHVTRCRFADNAWDGAAAMGAGSLLDIRDSQATGNFEHGIESWDGAAVVLLNNRCEGNGRNGIHADNPKSPATIEGNQLLANREFGLVLAAAGSGHIRKNTARGNLLGGFVIRAAARIPIAGNLLTRNQGPGLTLEKGLDPAAYADNTLSGNTGKQVLTDFAFPPAPTSGTPGTPAKAVP
ncbi:MAG: right-handed parallel beta-helix repeat-containing protein [Verrucomicrobia bacterium]|nr:right-handed parallel beta-helix repeat-containing protein [Verrucomicrobiota bacterium]